MRTQYDRAVMSAFGDELEKQAILGSVGKLLVRGASRGAQFLGKGKAFGGVLKKGISASGGGKGGAARLYRNVGAGTAIAAGAGATGLALG